MLSRPAGSAGLSGWWSEAGPFGPASFASRVLRNDDVGTAAAVERVAAASAFAPVVAGAAEQLVAAGVPGIAVDVVVAVTRIPVNSSEPSPKVTVSSPGPPCARRHRRPEQAVGLRPARAACRHPGRRRTAGVPPPTWCRELFSQTRVSGPVEAQRASRRPVSCAEIQNATDVPRDLRRPACPRPRLRCGTPEPKDAPTQRQRWMSSAASVSRTSSSGRAPRADAPRLRRKSAQIQHDHILIGDELAGHGPIRRSATPAWSSTTGSCPERPARS